MSANCLHIIFDIPVAGIGSIIFTLKAYRYVRIRIRPCNPIFCITNDCLCPLLQWLSEDLQFIGKIYTMRKIFCTGNFLMKTSHVYCLFSSCRRKQPGQEHLHRSSGKYSIMFFLFYYLSKEIYIYICFVFRPAMMDMCEKMWNFSVPKTQGRQPTNSRENCNAHARRVRFLRRSGRGGGPRDKSVKNWSWLKLYAL